MCFYYVGWLVLGKVFGGHLYLTRLRLRGFAEARGRNAIGF